MSWGFGLSVQILRNLFPFWGSYNTSQGQELSSPAEGNLLVWSHKDSELNQGVS